MVNDEWLKIPDFGKGFDASGGYGLSLKDLIIRGYQKLATDIDDEVKKVLFTGIKTPITAGKVDPKTHIKAQEAADKWVWTARATAGSKSFSIDETAQIFINAGSLDRWARMRNSI